MAVSFNPLDTTKRYLVTGAAGFIGFHLSKKLASQGAEVVGFDNVNDYYDVNLKYSRLDALKSFDNFRFVRGDLADADAVNALFDEGRFDVVVNLAAQAGVRYSITNPGAYINSNIIYMITDACSPRACPIYKVFSGIHLIYKVTK